MKSSRTPLLSAARLAGGLPPLLIRAERVAATVAFGAHARGRAGMGEKFWQFRPYMAPEPATNIDWKQTAKRSKPYVRQKEWETAQSFWLWAEDGAGMQYSSDKKWTSKATRAQTLLLALAILLSRAGETTGLLNSGLAPGRSEAGIWRMARMLEEENETTGDEEFSGEILKQKISRFSTAVLFGDFLTPPESLEKSLSRFSGQGVRGHLVQVLDPAELDFPFDGRVRFVAPAGMDEITVPNATSAREDYRGLIHNHCRAVEAVAKSKGFRYHLHLTGESPARILLSLYTGLSGKARFGA